MQDMGRIYMHLYVWPLVTLNGQTESITLKWLITSNVWVSSIIFFASSPIRSSFSNHNMYTIGYIVDIGLVEMSISTNPMPTVYVMYCNFNDNTGTDIRRMLFFTRPPAIATLGTIRNADSEAVFCIPITHPNVIICTSFISSMDCTVFVLSQCHWNDHYCWKVTLSNILLLLLLQNNVGQFISRHTSNDVIDNGSTVSTISHAVLCCRIYVSCMYYSGVWPCHWSSFLREPN